VLSCGVVDCSHGFGGRYCPWNGGHAFP
jgi:hypothetical protein